MPYACCAIGCTNRAHPDDNRQFFGFPLKNDELLKRWVIATKRNKFTPTKYTKICSDHFVLSDYLERPGSYIKHLKSDAVPSVFRAFSSHLQKNQNSRRPLKRNAVQSVDPTCSDNVKHGKVDECFESLNKEELELSSDVTLSSVPSTSTYIFTTCTVPSPMNNMLRRKIKTLRQKLKRREMKISNLNLLVQELKKTSFR